MANAPCDVVHSAMQGKAGDVVCWCHPPRVSLQNSRFKEKRMLVLYLLLLLIEQQQPNDLYVECSFILTHADNFYQRRIVAKGRSRKRRDLTAS